METTYSIRAHDQQVYGPYPLASVQAWIREGRITRDTPMTRSDRADGGWQPAGDYAELSFPAAAAPAPAIAVPAGDTAPAAAAGPDLAALKPGASWFYWIAGLTLVNFGAWLSGADFRFVVGTALVDVFNAVGEGAGLKAVAVVLDLLLIGLFVLCGVYAHKAHLWAFALGMGVYLVDTLLVLIAAEWLSVAFHAWALFSLGTAARLAWQIRRARRG
jgi:hypothetical protein